MGLNPVSITWQRCHSYDDARNSTGVIYLHEWAGKPFYWGKAQNSFFGGGSRLNEHTQTRMSGRYNSGYKHWIEGCLQNGGSLYIGKIDAASAQLIDAVETYLILTYPTGMNKKKTNQNLPALHLEHIGDVPHTISTL